MDINEIVELEVGGHGTFKATRKLVDLAMSLNKPLLVHRIFDAREDARPATESVTYWFRFPKYTLAVVAADMFEGELTLAGNLAPRAEAAAAWKTPINAIAVVAPVLEPVFVRTVCENTLVIAESTDQVEDDDDSEAELEDLESLSDLEYAGSESSDAYVSHVVRWAGGSVDEF